MISHTHAGTTLSAVCGDITTERVDVIVNAANSSLLGGGGVDGAIHRAGGRSILEECRRIVAATGPCPAGEAVITGAGALPARWVVHTVGPVWKGGGLGEAALLQQCYERSLARSAEVGARSIAFPAISTGAYRYPSGDAARIAVESCAAALEGVYRGRFAEIRFVLYSDAALAEYRSILSALL